MKTGFNASKDEQFPYWVLPDKPQVPWTTYTLEWDRTATRQQTEQIKGYLSGVLAPDTWIESNFRFYFKNKADFEMFQTICQIGWA